MKRYNEYTEKEIEGLARKCERLAEKNAVLEDKTANLEETITLLMETAQQLLETIRKLAALKDLGEVTLKDLRQIVATHRKVRTKMPSDSENPF